MMDQRSEEVINELFYGFFVSLAFDYSFDSRILYALASRNSDNTLVGPLTVL